MVKGLDSFDISLEDKKLILSVKKEKIIGEIIKKIESLGFDIVK